MNPLREKTEYVLVRGLIGLLRPFPEGFICAFFRATGALMFCFSFRRRNLSLNNLKIAFPEKSAAQRLGIAWRSFLNMAEFAGDGLLVLSGKMTPEKMMARVIPSGYETYRKLSASAQHGIINLTGHLGNWELLGNYGALRGFPSHVIARKGSNRLIDERIVVPMRTQYGNTVFYKDNAMLHSVKALKRNGRVSFLIDQKIGKKEGVPVTFFGQEILAVASCAVMQLRFSPAVIPAFMMKTGRREYEWIVGDPIRWTDDGSPADEQIQKLTQLHQTAIENMIRRYPDQWFWMHNRFRLPDVRTRRREKKRARAQRAQA